MPDEFLPSRTLDLEARIRSIEDWASLFSGRQSVDPTAVESTAGVPEPGMGGGGGTGTLIGDVTGPFTANTVGRLRNKSLTGTETAGYVYAYDGTKWVAQDFVSGNWGVGLATNPTNRFQVSSDSLDKETSWFQGVSSSLALGSRGWHLSKDKTQTFPSTWAWHSDGAPVWEIGMAGDTNNAHNFGFGAADLLVYDTTAVANSGGITARVSYEQAATNGLASKWLFGRNLTTSPRASTAFFEIINPAAVLSALRVRAAPAQSGELAQFIDAASVVQARITNSALFSCPGVGAGSERFGAGTLAAGASGTAVGNGASSAGVQSTALGAATNASGLQGTAVGYFAGATSPNAIAFGWDAQASGFNSVALGSSSRATATTSYAIGGTAAGNGAVAVGNGALASVSNAFAFGNVTIASGADSVCLGTSSAATANGAIAFGGLSAAAFLGSVAFGRSAVTTAANQLVFGSNAAVGYQITTAYFGSGVVDATPIGCAINATGGSGSNVTGATLTLAGGRGTGSAAGGDLVFRGTYAGSSGSTLNALHELMRLSQAGVLSWTQLTSVQDRTVVDFTPSWPTSTDATRKGRGIFSAWDTVAREVLRVEATGTAGAVGFLGAAAIPRPPTYVLAGSATRTLPADPGSNYTGIDNAQAGTPYAQLADLNTLRGVVSSLEGVVRQVLVDLASTSGYGLLVAS